MTGRKKLKFSLKFKEVEIEVDGASEGSPPRTLILREFNGAERDGYLHALDARQKVMDTGEVKVLHRAGFFAELLKRTLFERVGAQDRAVTEAEIQAFPAEMQFELYKEAQIICGLRKADPEPAAEGELPPGKDSEASSGNDGSPSPTA